MGWAGPTNWAGLSLKMCWADPGPTKIWYFSSGPDPTRKAELGQDQPGPATKLTGPEQVWPSTGNQRGELFSPHPPACRPKVLHAEGNAREENEMRGKGSLPGAAEAVSLLACTGPGWKKKEQIPAEEKESSRLELLV